MKSSVSLAVVVGLVISLSSCSSGQPATRTAEEARVMAASCLVIQSAHSGWLVHNEPSTTTLGRLSLGQVRDATLRAMLNARQFDDAVASRDSSDGPPYRNQDLYTAASRLQSYVNLAYDNDHLVTPDGVTYGNRYASVAAVCSDVR